MMDRALVLGSALLLWLSPVVVAQPMPIVATWNNPVGGEWDDASLWSTAAFPNNGTPNPGDAYHATIDATGSPYTVIARGGYTVDRLELASPDVTLEVREGGLTVSDRLVVSAGELIVNGHLVVDAGTDNAGRLALRNDRVYLTINGDFSQSIDGTTSFDAREGGKLTGMTVNGEVALDGGLDLHGAFRRGGQTTLLTGRVVSGVFDQTRITGVWFDQDHAVAVLYADGADEDSLPDRVRLYVTLFGDTNADGRVDVVDLDRLGASWGATGTTWQMGDFNYDGVTDVLDLDRLGRLFGQELGGGGVIFAPLPEPSSLGLLVIGGLACAGRRRA